MVGRDDDGHIHLYAYIHIYIHTNIGIGCSIWILAVFLSGISKYIDSYVFLFLARMISGVGEASLQVTLPPWIHEVSPEGSTGSWYVEWMLILIMVN